MVVKSFYRSVDIVNSVSKKIILNELIRRKDRILLSVSGGQDSTCLLFLLSQLSTQMELHLVLFWCHHLWQIDSFPVMRQIAQLSFLFQFNGCFAISLHFVPSELLARNWRHNCSYRICFFYNYHKICLAHSANDKVETILLNLMRGAGLGGLYPLRWRQMVSRKNIPPLEHLSQFSTCRISPCFWFYPLFDAQQSTPYGSKLDRKAVSRQVCCVHEKKHVFHSNTCTSDGDVEERCFDWETQKHRNKQVPSKPNRKTIVFFSWKLKSNKAFQKSRLSTFPSVSYYASRRPLNFDSHHSPHLYLPFLRNNVSTSDHIVPLPIFSYPKIASLKGELLLVSAVGPLFEQMFPVLVLQSKGFLSSIQFAEFCITKKMSTAHQNSSIQLIHNLGISYGDTIAKWYVCKFLWQSNKERTILGLVKLHESKSSTGNKVWVPHFSGWFEVNRKSKKLALQPFLFYQGICGHITSALFLAAQPKVDKNSTSYRGTKSSTGEETNPPQRFISNATFIVKRGLSPAQIIFKKETKLRQATKLFSKGAKERTAASWFYCASYTFLKACAVSL